MEKKINIRPKTRNRTGAIKEKNSYFMCPQNTVLTGRCHNKDENGNTWYEYCTLGAFDDNNNLVEGKIIVDDVIWSEWFNESSGTGFDAIGNRVIVGRQHNGDENGMTRYATAIIKFNGKSVTLNNATSSNTVKESKGTWITSPQYSFMTGRHHSGDENGYTFYNFAEAFYQFTPSDKAPIGTTIIPNAKHQSIAQKESGSSFLCPANTVITGFCHTKDENGTTTYEYADLIAISQTGSIVNGVISVEDVHWDKDARESEGGYDAPLDYVIVGRQHSKDENGFTSYAIGKVFFNGQPVQINNYRISTQRKEGNGSWFHCYNKYVMTSRHHHGDENGNTYYGMGTLCCDEHTQSNEDVIIHVLHDSSEEYFPMNPVDYIKLSRLRKHYGSGATDCGYNKVSKSFVKGNDKTFEYYNIPIEEIGSFRNLGKEKFLTLRPKDENSIGHDELFLQPDDHLHGDINATGRVSVYKYTEKGNDRVIMYWLFWGYDSAENKIIGSISLKGNHQGDWECIKIELDEERRIKQATLSCHTKSNTYQAKDLNICIDEKSGKEVLTVYCASGSHALYNNPGTYNREIGKDQADGKGYNWTITDKVESLNEDGNIWKFYSGAWGEVGQYDFTTGPLGPWYKCNAIMYEVQEDNSPAASELIKSDNEILLVHDTNVLRTSLALIESGGQEACAGKNQLLYSRVHYEDENGTTGYQFSTLKAIDRDGKDVKDDGEKEEKNGVEEVKITIEDLKWSDWHKQSDSSDFFVSIEGGGEDCKSRVITGRQHVKDENGMTRYQTGVVKYKGHPAEVIPYPDADLLIRENGSKEVLPKKNLVIIGIKHTGDENGLSTYCQGYIIAKKDGNEE